jgi:hypothetical protein
MDGTKLFRVILDNEDEFYIFSTQQNILKDLEKIKDEMGESCTYYKEIKILCNKFEIFDGNIGGSL